MLYNTVQVNTGLFNFLMTKVPCTPWTTSWGPWFPFTSLAMESSAAPGYELPKWLYPCTAAPHAWMVPPPA